MRIKLLVGALLLAGSLEGARAYAEHLPAPALPARDSRMESLVDFEAPVDLLPRDADEGLREAVRRAQEIAAESDANRRAAAAPPFVQKIAETLRARIDAITMLANDRTSRAGERALHEASLTLDADAQAVLAAHAPLERRGQE